MAAPIANGCKHHDNDDDNASPSNSQNGSKLQPQSDAKGKGNGNGNGNSNSNTTTTNITTSTLNHVHNKSLDDNANDDDNESEHKSLGLLEAGILKQHEIEKFTMNQTDIHKQCVPLTWSNCDATSFEVRRGPNYVSGQKSPSKKALYTIFAVDAYTTSRKIHKIWKYVDIEQHIKRHETPYNAKSFPLPPLFVLNVMIPNYPPELMGGKDDGEGLAVIIYAHISRETRAELETYAKAPNKSTLRPAVDLLQRFIHSDLVNSEVRNRFKCICRLMNPKHTDFGFLGNRLVGRYNSKPFLARTSSTFYHEPGQYFAADIDVHVFGYPARQGLSYVKNTLSSAVYDLGMTIEGHSNDELPEQILACCRVSKIGFDVAKSFPQQFMQRFIEEKEAEEAMQRMKLEENGDVGDDHHHLTKSESTGNLLNGKKPENGRTMPPHSQSARNALKPKTEPETENKGYLSLFHKRRAT